MIHLIFWFIGFILSLLLFILHVRPKYQLPLGYGILGSILWPIGIFSFLIMFIFSFIFAILFLLGKFLGIIK